MTPFSDSCKKQFIKICVYITILFLVYVSVAIFQEENNYDPSEVWLCICDTHIHVLKFQCLRHHRYIWIKDWFERGFPALFKVCFLFFKMKMLDFSK